HLEERRNEIQELKRLRDEMRSRLPDNAEIAELLQQIHSQAKIVGLEISRFERGEMLREALYARIPVKMILTGTFSQIASFYFNLGQLQRIVNVQDIELTTIRRGSDVSEERLVANCVATTYQYIPGAETAAAAPASAAAGGKK
ncbi:MAG: type 4a pilus biogenesis protein PilO, partial [bacterium]